MIPILEVWYQAGDPSVPKPGNYKGDIGIDIPAARLEAPVTILPGHGLFVWGGFRIQFPDGYAGLVFGRSSGNARGLIVPTGVIDNGYTGEIGAQLHNITCDPIVIHPGDRVAQMVLIPAVQPLPIPILELEKTDRADAGWGSSGR